MSNSVTDAGTRRSAIAVAQQEDNLQAVELRKQTGGFELLWTKSTKAPLAKLANFAADCGMAVRQTGDAYSSKAKAETASGKTIVVGFDSAGIALSRITVPAAGKEQISAMVRLQAEARLPLPPDQMEIAWRMGQVQDGNAPVTMAIAKRQLLQEFVKNVRAIEPEKILLNYEAIVRTWSRFFSGDQSNAVIVSMGARKTQVCLVENRKLTNAVALDMGIEDFSQAADSFLRDMGSDRFIQDMRSVLELFGHPAPTELPICVLSDGSEAIDSIVSCLGSEGFNAVSALPDTERITAQGESAADQIYQFRVPIGLALMVLEAEAESLNIFDSLYNPAKEREKIRWFHSPKITGAIAAAMLIVLVSVFYALDAAELKTIQKQLKQTRSEANQNSLMQRQELIRIVAQQRPDILHLLSEINTGDNRGIEVTGFDFKKSRPISISGQAQGSDQLYKFQRTLLARKGIKDVVIQNASPDTKTKKLKFTITFHYKNFTEKKSRTK